jgi:hypothetical protein
MISRRDLIAGAGIALAIPRAAAGRLLCRDFGGVRTCTVGVTANLNTAAQDCLEWCWAACIEAIFDFHDRHVRQERIAQKLFGAPICAPAFGPQIVSAIDGDWIDDSGNGFEASAKVLWDSQFAFGRPDAVAEAARELEAGNPLILGAMGHAMVMTAMTYSGNALGGQIDEIIVRDPWPGNPNRRSLSLQEALTAQFLAKVEVE